jgi:hypothetical protein
MKRKKPTQKRDIRMEKSREHERKEANSEERFTNEKNPENIKRKK